MLRLDTSVYAILVSALALGGAFSGGARAQEVVQQLPNPAAEMLNEALRRLSRNPQDLPALLAAAHASLELEDTEAALGFFDRAQAIAPDDGRVLAGQGQVAVREGDPVRALQLFDRADAAGLDTTGHYSDRGLAFDLVGLPDRAQWFYRRSLEREQQGEVVRRLALSLAISGDALASEEVLLPLLQRQDRSAYRTRAFALAIMGRPNEATAIAEAMLPARLSRRLAPYLLDMARLTPAQQAAAANLGQFPAPGEMGRDPPAIAALARGEPLQVARPASAAERLEPRGEPLGPSANQSVASEPQLARLDLPPTVPPIVVQPVAPTVTRVAPPAAPPPPAPAEPEPVELAEAFADFSLPTASPRSQPGAVDITTITPRRELPPPPPPPPAPVRPVHPARHWVQVATGQDEAAFRFDWRRIRRQAEGLLDDAEPHVAPWGQTNRLLVGPFANARTAQELVAELDGKGLDTFRFSSREGEQIEELD